MKMFGTVFFALCCFFFGWVILADSPIERINRGCTPMNWIGRAMTTIASFGSSKAEQQVADGSSSLFNGCRVFMFRQFYAEELAQLRAAHEAAQAGKGAVAPVQAPAGGAR